MLSRIEMVWQYPAGKFVDITFDDLGSTLYAWGNQELYGVLCAYSFEGAHGHGKEVFRARYKVQQELSLLIQGCVCTDIGIEFIRRTQNSHSAI